MEQMEDYGRKMSETMRIVFVLFTILVQQVLFAQDVEDNRVPVCGYYYEIYDKKEITDYYVNQYKRFTREETYSTTIDVSHKNHIIISEIAGRELFKRNQKEPLWDRFPEICSDTVYIYPKQSETYLYQQCGLELVHLGKIDFIKNCALKLSPFYASPNSKKLFRCFFFKGTAFIRNINELTQKWSSMLLDAHAVGDLKIRGTCWLLMTFKHIHHICCWKPFQYGFLWKIGVLNDKKLGSRSMCV